MRYYAIDNPDPISKAIQDFYQKENSPGTGFASEALLYTDFFSDKMRISTLIRAGIPWELFTIIQGLCPFSDTDWARFLNISTKTLQRYSLENGSVFKPLQSEKIMGMAEVTKAGMELFGDGKTFKRWLETPSFALGNARPIDLLEDSYGKELVLTELVRIAHGILA